MKYMKCMEFDDFPLEIFYEILAFACAGKVTHAEECIRVSKTWHFKLRSPWSSSFWRSLCPLSIPRCIDNPMRYVLKYEFLLAQQDLSNIPLVTKRIWCGLPVIHHRASLRSDRMTEIGDAKYRGYLNPVIFGSYLLLGCEEGYTGGITYKVYHQTLDRLVANEKIYTYGSCDLVRSHDGTIHILKYIDGNCYVTVKALHKVGRQSFAEDGCIYFFPKVKEVAPHICPMRRGFIIHPRDTFTYSVEQIGSNIDLNSSHRLVHLDGYMFESMIFDETHDLAIGNTHHHIVAFNRDQIIYQRYYLDYIGRILPLGFGFAYYSYGEQIRIFDASTGKVNLTIRSSHSVVFENDVALNHEGDKYVVSYS